MKVAIFVFVMAVVVFGMGGCNSKPDTPTERADAETSSIAPKAPGRALTTQQSLAKKDETPGAKGMKIDPPAKQSPKQDSKAAQLRRTDNDAMEAFRQGKQRDGMMKLLDAAKTYQKLSPADCSPEEALAVAVIYTRIAAIAGKSLPEETTRTYIEATREYSKKGGIATEDHQRWFKQMLSETTAALKSASPTGKPPAWVADAKKELEAAKRKPKPVEPLKPARMTPAEFDLLKDQAVDIFKTLYPLDNPAKLPAGEEAVMLLDIRLDAVVLMPESLRVVRREAYTRLAAHVKNDREALTNLANAFPETAKLHNDPKFLATMQARLPWAERKKLYDQFKKATDLTEKWSLLVPFDDLTGNDMRSAVAAAEKAKARGLGTVSAEDRALILRAGAIDFFASLLSKE